MDTRELLYILKTAANLEPELKDGHLLGIGAINLCPECDDMSNYDYSYKHYPKMKNMLESLPWTHTVKSPRCPRDEEYPSEDGEYLCMLDANEHEILFNTFRKGCWTLYHATHIKWWMEIPDDLLDVYEQVKQENTGL